MGEWGGFYSINLGLRNSYIWLGMVSVPYSVMLDGIAVLDGEGKVVPPGLRVPDEESSVFILTQQQLLLCLQPLYLSEVPPESKK